MRAFFAYIITDKAAEQGRLIIHAEFDRKNRSSDISHAAVWDKSIFWLAGGTDTSLSFFRLVEKILKNFAILAEGNAFIARFGYPRKKIEILSYFRHRAAEALGEIKQIYGETQYKKRASATNPLIEEKDRIVSQIRQCVNTGEIVRPIAQVMLESRNPYGEYMSFSLWDPFCPLQRDDVALFIPPLFRSPEAG